MPAACRRSITPLQLEASANAPWTRTTVRGALDACSDTRAPSLVGIDVDQRSDLNAARISRAKSSGSSQAGKWPPLSASLKYVTLGYDCSTQVRGAAKISPGNVVKPTGTETSGGAWPAARAWARPSSQYHRAAEAPVPVSQYSVMLSTIRSRVRLPVGCPSRKAREIL